MQFRAFKNSMSAPGQSLPALVEMINSPEVEWETNTAESLEKRNSRFVARRISRTELPALIKMVTDRKAKRFQLGAPRTAGLDQYGMPQIESSPLHEAARQIYLGIVDDGFPFAHPNLVRHDGAGRPTPMLTSIWDQTERAIRTPFWSPADIGLGQLLTDSAMCKAFNQFPRHSGVDETAVYAATQYKNKQPSVPHGSGVTHLLAGRNVDLPDGSRRDSNSKQPAGVFCVQLPDDLTIQDTAGGWLGFHALLGIRHIVQSAKEQAGDKTWHAIINLSYGSIAGPHDGTSMFEEAMEEICGRFNENAAGKVDIVLAAGNTRGKKIHAERTLAPNASNTFRFLAPPDNPRESYLELWIPQLADDGTTRFSASDIEVELVAPTGDAVKATVGQAHVLNLVSPADPCAGIVFAHRVAQGDKGTMLLLLLRPTQAGGQPDRAPAGVWQLRVANHSAYTVTVHAWAERNDMVVRHRRTQQARFIEDPDDAGHVNDGRTLSNAAGGGGVTVVGAVRQSDKVMAAYSGTDATRPSVKPDYFAASDAGAAMPGVLIDGFYSGTTVRMSGTSVAAPWVARWIARGRPSSSREPDGPPSVVVGPPTYRTIASTMEPPAGPISPAGG
jgi:hypothetical protein